jgi:mono/diheme cytochrome c family protein
MSDNRDEHARRPSDTSRRLKLAAILLFALLAVGYRGASTQNPVFDISIDQQKLRDGGYTHAQVIEAGGQFWTTPYTRYDKATKTGDGYGEGGADAPRAAQRKAFNPEGFPTYPFLRLNGLDSQSCFECHNSIGSDPGYGAGSPLIRKQPSSVGGSAGSNSNAFINPCFPGRLTLFIRQPPHVFGSGYVQSVGDEVTTALYSLRKQARVAAMNSPGRQQTVSLLDTKHNLDYGTFKTTFIKGSQWKLVNNKSGCPNNTCGVPNPPSTPPVPDTDLGAVVVAGFTDDVGSVTGISSDLVVRPFQWKGVASSLRHFVRDALDFHLSMQAEEKVGGCDCDKDGKTKEVSRGNVSAITAFVGMTRPPQQAIPPGVSPDSVERGYEIFTGMAANVKFPAPAAKMCATCHTPSLPLANPNPQLVIDDPVGNTAPNCVKDCPLEATGSYTSLVSPLRAHVELPVLKRIKAKIKRAGAERDALADLTSVPDPTYNIPLNSTDVPAASLPRLTQTAPFFLANLPQPPAGGFYVPFFSDLHTHDMGAALMDVTAQGSDVGGVCIQPRMFMTRPLWGVADTGPWLHDGRATTLMQAIMMHGDSKVPVANRSEAAPIIDAFEKLSDGDKQAVVNFLLSLRLPVEQGQGLALR